MNGGQKACRVAEAVCLLYEILKSFRGRVVIPPRWERERTDLQARNRSSPRAIVLTVKR